MKELLNEIYRYLIPALCIIIAAYCVKHLLSSRAPKVTPAYFYDEQNGKEYVITNWETSIGRSNACDGCAEQQATGTDEKASSRSAENAA